jgi:hypothetical protein
MPRHCLPLSAARPCLHRSRVALLAELAEAPELLVALDELLAN